MSGQNNSALGNDADAEADYDALALATLQQCKKCFDSEATRIQLIEDKTDPQETHRHSNEAYSNWNSNTNIMTNTQI